VVLRQGRGLIFRRGQWLLSFNLGLQMCNPSLGFLQLLIGLVQLYFCTLEISVESCSDSSKDVDAVFTSFSHQYHSLLRATDTARKVTKVGGAQLQAVSVAEGPQSPSSGVAHGGSAGSMGRGGVVRRLGFKPLEVSKRSWVK
jgi:hypothetical protein